MDFDRRTFLHTGIVATAGALAGCPSGGSSDADGETPTTTDGLTTDRIETIRTQAQDRRTVYRKYARFFSTEETLRGMAERTLPGWTDLLPTPRALDAVETARTVLLNDRDLDRLEVLRLGSRTETVGHQTTPTDEADEARATDENLAEAAAAVADAAATYRDTRSAKTLATLRAALERERRLVGNHPEIAEWAEIAPGAYGGAGRGSSEAAEYVKRMATSNDEALVGYRQQLATHLDWVAATETATPETPTTPRDTPSGPSEDRRFSFETAPPGSPPADPWYVLDENGQLAVSDRHASVGEQSLHVASYNRSLAPTRAAVDVDLTPVDTVRLDAYVVANYHQWGYLKVDVDNDENTIINLTQKQRDEPTVEEWYYDQVGDVSEYSGRHALVCRAEGGGDVGNDAYFDNVRFYASGDPLPVSEVLSDG